MIKKSRLAKNNYSGCAEHEMNFDEISHSLTRREFDLRSTRRTNACFLVNDGMEVKDWILDAGKPRQSLHLFSGVEKIKVDIK